jgi:multiple sugar transport system permease protein
MKLRAFLAWLALAAFALLFVAPIGLMVVGSLKPDHRVLPEAGDLRAFVPEGVSLENYADVFERVPFGRYLLNSTVITAGVVLFGLLVNSMAGYALVRLSWPGRGALFALVAAILIIPLEAIAVPLYYMAARAGLRDTYAVQILPFVANAFSIHLFAVWFRSLPRELEEAAWIDGAGPLRTFFTIIVPNSKPVFATAAILTFLMQWSAFLWPLLVTAGERVRPLPLGIATFYTLPPLQWGDIMAFGVLMTLPVVTVFLVFQRWFVRGVATAGIKG